MTKTTEQIREEAERMYPLMNTGMPHPRPFNKLQNMKRQAFIAACNWLQSEQAPTPPQGEEVELEDGFYTDRNGFKYKMSVQSDKTIFERMDGNRAGNYFVYHPKNPEISILTAELTALREETKTLKSRLSCASFNSSNYEKELLAERELNERFVEELTALRSQLSEAQENYEKVWDAAVESHWYDTIKGKGGVKLTTTPPPDKTTFINKIKKGKE
jgi:hypothetical protein